MNVILATILCLVIVCAIEVFFYKGIGIITESQGILGFVIGEVGCVLFIYGYVGAKNFYSTNLFALMILVLSVSFLYGFLHLAWIYFRKRKQEKFTIAKNVVRGIVLIGLLEITLLLEIFVFNYKFAVTKDNTPIHNHYVIGSGLEYQSDNQYKVVAKENCFVSFAQLSDHINAVKADIERMDAGYHRWEATRVTYYATDAANSTPLNLGNREVFGPVESSQYAHLHLKGESDQLRLEFNAEEGDILYINEITINPVVPMTIQWWRMGIVFSVLFLLVLFRPKSFLYQIPFSRRKRKQWLVVVLLIGIEALMFARMTVANTEFSEPRWIHHYQYQSLAKAFANGQLYLETEPPQTLLDLENPYDNNARTQAMAENGETYLWDHAYYDEKYYVYFGVIPELVFYYPYYLITHEDFSTVWGIAISGVLLLIALTQLVRIIIERWFEKTSFGMYLLVTILLVNCTGLLFMMAHPDFYGLPILMALLFAATGLYFWICALKEHDIHGGYLFLGSLFLALIAGCRPQLVLVSFVAFPLFMGRIVKDRALFSKKTLVKTCMAFVPYVVVAAGLMYYNYARFGSVFDFGANYNLTTNDMTNRFPSMELSLIGLFMYFLQPVNVGLRFPFVAASNMNFSYLGNNIWETMYGGLMLSNPVLLLVGKFSQVKNRLKEKGLFSISIFFIGFAVVIALIDIIGAGILPRYLCDFSLFMYLGVLLVILSLEEQFTEAVPERQNRWRKWLLILIGCSVLYQFVMIFANTSAQLSLGNPALYYNVCYGLQFWL